MKSSFTWFKIDDIGVDTPHYPVWPQPRQIGATNVLRLGYFKSGVFLLECSV